MSDSIVLKDHAPRPVGMYPHARRVGNLLLLSGIGPRDPDTNQVSGDVRDQNGKLMSYDIEAQCRAVFRNVRAVLESAGLGLEDLVDVTVYLTDLPHDFRVFNEIWAEYFPSPERAPCRTTVGVSYLPTPIAVEMKCVAALRS
ncbi:RidA family protein [Cognatilysobacter terrigena]|uniref:RidA family protein n=1 Tax=Cognatilysobacter terrigena TaxID=2488749 RepID=UPI00105D0968|nr:RidA family protein [Lysobacter terrigena]